MPCVLVRVRMRVRVACAHCREPAINGENWENNRSNDRNNHHRRVHICSLSRASWRGNRPGSWRPCLCAIRDLPRRFGTLRNYVPRNPSFLNQIVGGRSLRLKIELANRLVNSKRRPTCVPHMRCCCETEIGCWCHLFCESKVVA